MYTYKYHRPASLEAATDILANAGEDARPLAGGMSLIPVMKHRLANPSDLVDLAAIIDLAGIRVENDRLIIKAMTRHAAVAASPEVAATIPALTTLAAGIGDPLVRNRGTIGGSLANNDPAACYPSAVLGLGAEVVTTTRTVQADDFFKGLFETALAPDELITEVRFPIPAKAAYKKFPNPASRFSIVGVFLVQLPDNSVRVAVTGAGACVFRVKEFEIALSENFTTAALASLSFQAEALTTDLHGTADYRADLIKVLTQDAVAACG